jgi:hypothetical protein
VSADNRPYFSSDDLLIPGSGTTDSYNIEGEDRPETRPVIPLGHKSYSDDQEPCIGFFTDTSVCIGCKAC